MNSTDAILASGIVITGTTLIRNAHQGKSHAAPIVFGFMLVAGLLAINIAAPRFAKGLAYLGMVGAFVVNGPTLFSVASGISGSKSPGISFATGTTQKKGTTTAGGRG